MHLISQPGNGSQGAPAQSCLCAERAQYVKQGWAPCCEHVRGCPPRCSQSPGHPEPGASGHWAESLRRMAIPRMPGSNTSLRAS